MRIIMLIIALAAVNVYAAIKIVDRQSAMTIEYKARLDKDVLKKEMVIIHPAGIVSRYDEKNLNEWREQAIARRDEAIAELKQIDEQIIKIREAK